MREVGAKIAAIDKELAGVELILQDRLLRIPNMTDASVPVGKDDSEIRKSVAGVKFVNSLSLQKNIMN